MEDESRMTINKIQYDEKGLVPAIIQDYSTGEVLMLAYMNDLSLGKTIETKETWFFSRSRQELWHKGATSGNRQRVERMTVDCDQDALLIEVTPLGPACHTGERTCFSEIIEGEEQTARTIVYEVIREIQKRAEQPVEGSYTSYLLREGIDKVLKKVGEESSEVIIGAKNADHEELTNELADLLYHTLVLMEITDVTVADIKAQLVKRRR